MNIPANAYALIEAVGQSFDPPMGPFELLCEPADMTARRNRHRVWKALREEQDDYGKPRYTLAQIGWWFGVKRHTVFNAIKRLDGGLD